MDIDRSINQMTRTFRIMVLWLKMSWIDRIINDQVLRRVNKEQEIIISMKRCKLEYVGHIIRNEQRYGQL